MRWEADWQDVRSRYRGAYPDLAGEFERVLRGALPADWAADLPVFPAAKGEVATRDASGKVMNAVAKRVFNFYGGSADLAPSTKTTLVGYGDFGFDEAHTHNIHYGIREHAMGAIANGMALHGGVIPYTATFLVFSDYMRPPLRLAALMKARVIFIFTHDSIAMGEDGPTHQPVEQLISLRAIPGLTVLRPADANETAEAWRVALEQPGPSVLVLTRQKLPVLDPQRFSIHEGVRRGGYVLAEAKDGPSDVVLIGTGSEVHLALAARERLAGQGVRARVVSMPSWELFDAQPPDYRKAVLPPDVPALAVEAGSPRGWRDYVGDRGDVIGVNRFGASAPGPVMLEQFGFTAEHIAARARTLVEGNRAGRGRERPAAVAPKS